VYFRDKKVVGVFVCFRAPLINNDYKFGSYCFNAILDFIFERRYENSDSLMKKYIHYLFSLNAIKDCGTLLLAMIHTRIFLFFSMMH
jgi:hypothetical protein